MEGGRAVEERLEEAFYKETRIIGLDAEGEQEPQPHPDKRVSPG